MPFQPGKRLPGERASKIGHLEVLKNPLVNSLCEKLKDEKGDDKETASQWTIVSSSGKPLSLVFAVDGSLQYIVNEQPPYNARAFVKTALLRLDQHALSQVDKDSPHPFVLRDILKESAMYHATVIPLRHVKYEDMTLYDAVRHIVFRSLHEDSLLENQPYEAFKWLIYQKWDAGHNRSIPDFKCPHCDDNATLPFDADTGNCSKCGKELFVTDMLGFHQEMAEDAAPDTVASSYMAIHETLMLFAGVRYYWEKNRELLSDCLFIKDGPLSIRAQYSKLVAPIRNFLSFALKSGTPVHIIGQEKTGTFVDHLNILRDHAPFPSYFIPNDAYIKERIQHRPDQGAAYGKDTNYGAKVFLKLNAYHSMVLNVPTGQHVPNPTISDLIEFDRIVATLPGLLSNRYEGALMPIELANGVASLSTYPSARILKMFANKSVPQS
jgi:hypothetical protein